MILLAFALTAAASEPPRAQVYVPRIVATHRARPRRHVARARQVPMNVIAQAPHDRNARYRLPLRDNQIVDFKTRVVQKGAAAPCGTTGSSICPHDGMTIVRAPLSDSN